MVVPPSVGRPIGALTGRDCRVLYFGPQWFKGSAFAPRTRRVQRRSLSGPQWQSNHFLDRHARLRRARTLSRHL